MRPRDGRVALATGVTVAYADRGDPDGIPLLVVHAWAESFRAFDPMVAALAGDLRVIGFDLRGHGGSEKTTSGHDLMTLADDCAAFLDALDVAAAYVVGSSSGGYVAQQLAVSHADRVRGLVLVGAPFTLDAPPSFVDDVMAFTDPVPADAVRALNARMTRRRDIPAEYVEQRVDDGLALPAAVWKASLRGLVDSERPTRRHRIDVPTLIVWGEDDDVLGEAQLDGLVEAVPHSQVVRYAGTGHLVLWEEPLRVAGDVTAFLRSRAGVVRVE